MNLDIIRKAKANKIFFLGERNGFKVLKPIFQKTPNAEEFFICLKVKCLNRICIFYNIHTCTYIWLQIK